MSHNEHATNNAPCDSSEEEIRKNLHEFLRLLAREVRGDWRKKLRIVLVAAGHHLKNTPHLRHNAGVD